MKYYNHFARIQKPGKAFLVIKENKVTYGEQWRRCMALSGWLKQYSDQGVVLVAVNNELEQASILSALIVIGFAPLIVDTDATSKEIKAILDNSNFDYIIAEDALNNAWGLNTYSLPKLIVQVNNASRKGIFGKLLNKHKKENISKTQWPDLINNGFSESPVDDVETGLAYIIFTSGTTSKPKGVEIAQQALSEQLMVLVKQYKLDEQSNILNTLPLHHADGLVQGPMLAWACGGTVYRPMKFAPTHIQAYMDSIYHNRITHFIAVPAILSLMVKLGLSWKDNFENSDFKFIVSTAGHLEEYLWRKLEQIFNVQVVNIYGLTETCVSALFNGPDEKTRRVGCLGMPVNCDIRIVENDIDVAVGETGELLISGSQLMCGYHRDQDGTDRILKNGWLYSGDLVKQLNSGHIMLKGRKKNQVNTGGRLVSPEEVMACINTHPDVLESFVFGVQNDDWEEEVVALVNARNTDLLEITQWCRNYLSEYKIPRHIIFTDTLEKGPSGKIIVESAKQIFQDKLKQLKEHMSLSTDVESIIISIASSTFRLDKNCLDTESNIDNTPGWDSLAHMSFILLIEKQFDIHFSPSEFMQLDSISKTVHLCQQKLSE